MDEFWGILVLAGIENSRILGVHAISGLDRLGDRYRDTRETHSDLV